MFDEYLVYRPDWISRWEREAPDLWQAELWRRLAAESPGLQSVYDLILKEAPGRTP